MDRRPPPRAPDSGHHEVASDTGGERAAVVYSLIETCKLNGIDPEAYLRDVLTRIAELLPWHWTDRASQAKAA